MILNLVKYIFISILLFVYFIDELIAHFGISKLIILTTVIIISFIVIMFIKFDNLRRCNPTYTTMAELEVILDNFSNTSAAIYKNKSSLEECRDILYSILFVKENIKNKENLKKLTELQILCEKRMKSIQASLDAPEDWADYE